MEKYNGWTNYNTWKVNLELVDSDYYLELFEDYDYNLDELAESMQETVLEFALYGIDENNYFAISAVEDFLQQVNWHEIVKNIID